MKDLKKFKGMFPPIITPFKPDGSVDYDSLSNLIRQQIKNGMHGMVILGSTAEFSSLSDEERNQIAEKIVEEVDGSVPLILGVGHSGTQQVIRFCKKAEELGIDGVQVPAPYYYPPAQDNVYEHFKAVAEATSLPVFIYDYPGTTKFDFPPSLVAKLSEIDNIVGLKLSGGSKWSNLEKARQVREMVNNELIIYTGQVPLFYHGLKLQLGDGAVIGPPNPFPKEYIEAYNLATKGELEKGKELLDKFSELHVLLSAELGAYPRYCQAFKLLTKWRGFIEHDTVRQPLLPLEEYRVSLLKEAYERIEKSL